MTATHTLARPGARSIAPFMPPASTRTASPALPQAAPRAALAPAAAPVLTPPPRTESPPAPPSAAAELARARWSARVAFASVLVVVACEIAGMAGSIRGNAVVVAGAVVLGGAALEGWRRARSLRAQVSALGSALRAARETERWHRAVVDDVNDAVMVASPEGRMVEVNQAATVLLGRDREWLMGRRLWDLLPLDDRLVALRRGDMVATNGGGLRRMLRPDGSEVAADVSWSTLEDGRVIYLARRFGPW